MSQAPVSLFCVKIRLAHRDGYMNFLGVLCFSLNNLVTFYIPLHDFITVCFKTVLMFFFFPKSPGRLDALSCAMYPRYNAKVPTWAENLGHV